MATAIDVRQQRQQRQQRAVEKAETSLLGAMTKRMLAQRSHLHHSYVCRIFNGERRPSVPATQAMAQALRLTTDEFYARLTRLRVLVLARPTAGARSRSRAGSRPRTAARRRAAA